MVALSFLSRPNILGKPTVHIGEVGVRHCLVNGHTPYDRFFLGSGGGSDFSNNTSISFAIMGGIGHSQIWGVGTWVEWNLGLLCLDRQWKVSLFGTQSTTSGIGRILIDGVQIGATFSQYTSGAYSAAPAVVRTFDPIDGDGAKAHKLRIEVTALGAGSGSNISWHTISLDRTIGLSTVSLI